MSSNHDTERNRLIRMIHAGARDARITNDERRALQQRTTGVASCATMTINQLHDVIAVLNARGANIFAWQRQRAPSAARVADDRGPLLRKLYALAKAQSYPHPAYVLGISQRMWGEGAPARIEWHTPAQLRALVASLTYDQRRKRKRQPTPPSGGAAA